MSCAACRISPEMRAAWGCDAPVPEGVAEVHGCYACDGTSEACETCHGTDRWMLDRCPNKLLNAAAIEVCQHAEYLAAGLNVWPVDGGTQRQAAVFMDALRLALHLKQRYEPKKPAGGADWQPKNASGS